MSFDPNALLKRIREGNGNRTVPRPDRRTYQIEADRMTELIRQKDDDHAVNAMRQKWNHAFSMRLWPRAKEAGTAEIVAWLKQNIAHGGWGVYKHDQRVIGIRDENDALAFKMRWR